LIVCEAASLADGWTVVTKGGPGACRTMKHFGEDRPASPHAAAFLVLAASGSQPRLGDKGGAADEVCSLWSHLSGIRTYYQYYSPWTKVLGALHCGVRSVRKIPRFSVP